jgi:hypothetical protein
MSQNPDTRIRGHQPPLPLVEAAPSEAVPAAPGATPATASGADAEWRLDEHTRTVGRMGIAAARARLKQATGSGGSHGSAPVRQAPGRAA